MVNDELWVVWLNYTLLDSLNKLIKLTSLTHLNDNIISAISPNKDGQNISSTCTINKEKAGVSKLI